MLFKNVVVALSLTAGAVARVSQPQIRSEGAMCFDAGDCILSMATSMSWNSCDRSSANSYLFGLLGSCVASGAAAAPTAAPAASSASGIMSSLSSLLGGKTV